MKCQFCAGDLSIENAFCPHCGKANPFYAAHREDMERYEDQFEKVKDQTIKKNERDTRKAVRITIIAVLTALILGAVIVLICMDDINYSIRKASNKRNAEKIVKNLEELEANQDYINFHIYYSGVYSGTYGTRIQEFVEVDNVAFYYSTLVDRVASFISGEYYGDSSDLAKNLNSYFEYMYEVFERSEKSSKNAKFSPQHMESINNLFNDSCILMEKYFGIPRDILMDKDRFSETERQLMFEKYIEKVTIDE